MSFTRAASRGEWGVRESARTRENIREHATIKITLNKNGLMYP